AAEFQAIAEDIERRDDHYRLTGEGRTGNLPPEEDPDNDELSDQRAETEVSSLRNNGNAAEADITAKGMGADTPEASNDTDAGRQENRRVVITDTPDDYEPEIDFEFEGSETGDE